MVGIRSRFTATKRHAAIARSNPMRSSIIRPLSLYGRRCYRGERQRIDDVRRHASSASSPDPYQVLGVSKKMSSDSIQRAYRNKLREAQIAGDEELVNVIEQAHSSIMMQELSLRMKGQGHVSQDIAYADKAVYLPWRPRWCLADRRLMLISVALQMALLLYSVALGGTSGTQPVIGSAIACATIVYFKLEKLFPSGAGVAFSADERERKRGGKNVLRSIVVALMGTAAGIVCFFTLPDLISNVILHRPLPYWIYDYQDTVLSAGAVFMNLLLSIFFR